MNLVKIATSFQAFMAAVLACLVMVPQFRAAAADIVQAGKEAQPVRESVQQQVQQTQLLMQMLQMMQAQQQQMQQQITSYHAVTVEDRETVTLEPTNDP